MSTGADSLLVVVEPPSGEPGGDPASGLSAAGAVLVAECARLAGKLGAGLRVVTWPPGPDFELEQLASVLADVAERTQPVAVLLADTDVGRQVAPLVAHRLGSGAVVGCSDVLVRDAAGAKALTFVKPVYGGWLEQEIDPARGSVPVGALDLTGLEEPGEGSQGLPVPETLEIATAAPSRVRRLELTPPDARSVDLVHAKRIVAAGSGSASDELLAAVRELADLLEGSVGATRPVVDDGRLPKERLIGQTGRAVSPELYLALGISGSPHHVAGIRKADKILSINRDVRAPIFQFSDVGYVADLEVVLPALVQKIKEWRDASGSAD